MDGRHAAATYSWSSTLSRLEGLIVRRRPSSTEYVVSTASTTPAPAEVPGGTAGTVRLNRRTYSPVLRQADIPQLTVPWRGGRTLRFEYT
jgi:hypothetical protein